MTATVLDVFLTIRDSIKVEKSTAINRLPSWHHFENAARICNGKKDTESDGLADVTELGVSRIYLLGTAHAWHNDKESQLCSF